MKSWVLKASPHHALCSPLRSSVSVFIYSIYFKSSFIVYESSTVLRKRAVAWYHRKVFLSKPSPFKLLQLLLDIRFLFYEAYSEVFRNLWTQCFICSFFSNSFVRSWYWANRFLRSLLNVGNKLFGIGHLWASENHFIYVLSVLKKWEPKISTYSFQKIFQNISTYSFPSFVYYFNYIRV
jgi:hypothetical protein